jgi:hypothetical protein
LPEIPVLTAGENGRLVEIGEGQQPIASEVLGLAHEPEEDAGGSQVVVCRRPIRVSCRRHPDLAVNERGRREAFVARERGSAIPLANGLFQLLEPLHHLSYRLPAELRHLARCTGKIPLPVERHDLKIGVQEHRLFGDTGGAVGAGLRKVLGRARDGKGRENQRAQEGHSP